MGISELLNKMARGERLTDSERQALMLEARRMEETSALIISMIQPGTSNLKVDAITANNAYINRAEINGAVIKNATIDSATAGNGSVTFDGDGISIVDEDGTAWLSWYDDAGGLVADMSVIPGRLGLAMRQAGDEFTVFIKLTDNSTPSYNFEQDPAQANRTLFTVADGAQGARFQLGSDAKIDLRTAGSSGGQTFIRIRETATTPVDPGASDAAHIYIKGDKLVVQFDDAGTVRYKYLDLTGTGATWVHTTSAP